MATRAHRSCQRRRHAIEPINQRPQRRWGKHRLACAPQPVRAAVRAPSGSTQDRSLADPGFSTQEHASSGRAASAQCGEALGEDRQLGVALDQQIIWRTRGRFVDPGGVRDAVHAQEAASHRVGLQPLPISHHTAASTRRSSPPAMRCRLLAVFQVDLASNCSMACTTSNRCSSRPWASHSLRSVAKKSPP